jgi:hypothetical protein
MQPSIPAATFVNVIPSVLAAGAANLAMNSVILTDDPSIPVGTLAQFGNAASVGAWFGLDSLEYQLAGIYFAGYNGATSLPSVLYFAQYNTAPVAAYLRGAPLTGVTLAELGALAGTITVVIDGVSHVSAAINLTGVGSFSAAAALIQTGLQGGTPSTTATVTYDAQLNAFVITSSTTGGSSTLAFPTTDAFTTGLLLTSATGAQLSQGAAAAVPGALMTTLTNQSQDWATFFSVLDPDAGAAGGPIKVEFSTWVSQNPGYAYIAYDSDPTPSEELNDSACYAAQVEALNGTIPIWSPAQGAQEAAFIAGFIASINWDQPGGRTTAAYRSSPSVTPDVTNLTTYLNLKGNGYNCYAAVATRTATFNWFQPGQMTGTWEWIDPYINQIYWNARFQNDFAELLSQVPDVPYTPAGYNMIREALSGDIQAMGAFGAWVPGVVLSGAQQVAVNTAAGLTIAPILSSQGWYLQVTDPGPSARGARTSPNVTFWYTDGGAVQQIVMASIDIE